MPENEGLIDLIFDVLPWMLWGGLALYFGVVIIRNFPTILRNWMLDRDRRREAKARHKEGQRLAAERDRLDQETPPWVEPRSIDSSMNTWAYPQLLARLDPVDADNPLRSHNPEIETLRDRETGQHWHQLEDEVGFNRFMALHPVTRSPTNKATN